ncbi:thiol-disulfide oxidoreductase DCC family protein [Flavobacterium suncheonense]|uniref:Thiol-disulfide oxidoreductase n=1 Tax=Flavobacterium suncheonense GH29-5 = DSM 17707 TaxID=1121899 RepID=A0A0A2MET3_9FLAO|nr:thiol-disulfide oxidoreductase DCC family protein [Flavobacterium suncheonense]KGO89968.1 thiol-disulfide oxidoreductase [Flavobacterium suncheonense GH29-5 = DSM 17707]
MEKLPKDKKIILFDGVCNLCDATVQKVIKADKNDTFRFVALQSDLGKEILNYIGVDPEKTDSIILYEPGIAYHIKAGAAIEIARTIGGIYSLLVLFSVFPDWLKDIGYDFVARNRYKWFGKKESCMIPSPEIKAKFLE